ncbi:MAG TPA: ABC transporter permease [Stenotrophomonas sp.]|jgi:putative ABC transport system permease protein
MQSLRTWWSATGMNLQALTRRRLNALVMVLSIAGVVAVFSFVLAMNAGLDEAMRDAGHPDRAVVLRAGSTVEISSAISHEQVTLIRNAADARRGADGVPLITAEAAAPLTLIEKRSGMEVNGTLRGVGPEALAVRPEIRIVAGRMFEPGKREIVVGEQALRQFEGLALGSEVAAYRNPWKVVGVYTAGKSFRESELMADADVVMNVSQRPMFQNVTVALPDAAALAKFKQVITRNPAVALDVFSEPQYLQRESQSLNGLLHFMAWVMGGIMALGAAFVAINAMYASIDDRRREIATLRALGFRPWVVIGSIVAEALVLALLGGLLGAGAAWWLVNGHTISTAVGGDLRQLVFKVAMTPAVLLQCLVAALVIGGIGGLIPALQAVRRQVVEDLRAF